MAKINLLPWREEYRQEKKKEFITQLFGFCVFAGLSAYVWITSVDSAISNQQQRNKMLEDEIVLLDAQVKEIQELKKKRSELIARMKVIQDLQGTRPTVVRYFDELVRSIPDGVFINSLVKTGDQIAIEGISESANRVSAFMRQLDDSPWFAEPNLKSVTNDPKFGEQAAKFSLQLKTVLPADKEEKEKGGGNG
jgi:type IV pilus assembly protein PilN